MGSLRADTLGLEIIRNMTPEDKELERVKRDRNIAIKKLEVLQKKYNALEQRNNYTEQRNDIQNKLEEYLPHRIKKLKDINKNKAYDLAVCELQMLYDALVVEKSRISDYEVENEEKL